MQAVEGRIGALAQTHELLSQSRWQGADVHRLVMEEIAPYRNAGNRKITIDGPSLLVAPETAQSIALTLHELATNAAKYGALSAKDGELSVHWTVKDGRLVLDWAEKGGPDVTPPTATGFGMKIINANLGTSGKGEARFDWRPEGLHCRIDIACGQVAGPTKLESARNTVPAADGRPFGTKLLLVEDEALIGILLHDMLVDWGFEPSEPYAGLDEAMSAASEGQFEGAILDMNLNGKSVYPLAELLQSRGVPFVFLTGYGQHTIDKRFASCPMLQKPVAPEALKAILKNTPALSKAVA